MRCLLRVGINRRVGRATQVEKDMNSVGKGGGWIGGKGIEPFTFGTSEEFDVLR